MKTLLPLLVCGLLLAPLTSEAGQLSPREAGGGDSIPPSRTHGEGNPTKDPEKALHSALVHTMVPIGLGGYLGATTESGPLGIIAIGYGMVVGPSAGNFYAEDYFRGTLGVGIRLVCWTIVADAIGRQMSHKTGTRRRNYTSAPVTLAALGLAVGSTAWNIATAPDSARKFNARHQRVGYVLMPILDPISETVGVVVCITM
ncbi:MAG: hypothetical protein AMJ46_10725 [Latescibacteria bacterium DG_63]|nr:MAG: hypothetical protein AMJ46_10725 [Latescibacteria bacterium DG_63]